MGLFALHARAVGHVKTQPPGARIDRNGLFPAYYTRMIPCASLTLSALLGTMTASLAAKLDFYRDVYPFLKTNCISCHNKTTTKADLNMETPELMLKGGETGPGLVPGKGMESLVVQAALHQGDMEMPPKNNKSGAMDLTPA